MKSRKLVLYLDTSVIGGYYDSEFEQDTKPLFESIRKGEFEMQYSTITEDELLNAPLRVRELIDTIPDAYRKKVALTEEITNLADSYIAENVVGKTSHEDCLHIALATVHRADILVSWNFKHIVNVMRIRGYNAVNIKYGYPSIDIRSPKDIINYGKE
jgi:predicted nucleic acid-binding protein